MKKRVILLAFAGIALMGLLLIRSSGRVPFDSIRRVPFDSERWRRSERIDFGELRRAMARDLLSSKALVGLRRAEVLSLLGNPTVGANGSTELRYELNEEHRGGNIDPTDIEYLLVTLDADDRTIGARYYVWCDKADERR